MLGGTLGILDCIALRLRAYMPCCACRYRKGLPPTVMRMNEECLRLRPHDHPGYQTVQEIRAIVSQAIGPVQHQHHKPRDGLESLVDHLALDDSQYF